MTMQRVKVTYIGLNNLFSRVITLLLRQSPVVSKLILYGDKKFSLKDDLTTGRSECQIISCCDRAQIFEALEGVDIVLIGDEVAKSNHSDYEITASKLYDYAKAIAQVSPNAFLVVAAWPINVFMPFIAQLYNQLGCLNASKLIGASTVDTVRANALLAAQLRMYPTSVVLPVVGGCSPLTRVPLFSHAYPSSCISYITSEKKKNIINKIRNNDKNKQDDAIEKAYATVRLIHSISAAITGPTQIPEIALVKNYTSLNAEYFALPLLIGKKGVEKVFTLKNITRNEERMVIKAIENMNMDVGKARDLLSMQNVVNDDEELCNEEEDCVFVNDVNYMNEEPQKGQKRTSEKDFKSTKVEDMVPLHCPAEPYLETPSATRQKGFEEKKPLLDWRLVPPYGGGRKKSIGDFNDKSDFNKLPGIDKYLREEDKNDGRFQKTEEIANHSMKASKRSDEDKGNQYKFPDDMQTEFTLDSEADIESIKEKLQKSIEAIKIYNKVHKREDNNKTNCDENLDDIINQNVHEEHDTTTTNFENKFTNINRIENNYLEESDTITGESDQQRESADCPNVLQQEVADGNISTTTKHPAGTLETPSMDAEYRILLVKPNVREAETNKIPEDIENYNVKYMSEQELLKSQYEEVVNEPSSLIIKINDNQENTLKHSLKPKLESKQPYFPNDKTISKSDIALKGTDMPKTPSRTIKSKNLETYSKSAKNEESSLLNTCDTKLNMHEMETVEDVIDVETDSYKSESCYTKKENRNNNVVTHPVSGIRYDTNKQNVVRDKGSPPASRLHDKNKQNMVTDKESTNSKQDFQRNDNQTNHNKNVQIHSYSIFGQENNITSLHPTNYLTERTTYKRKAGEDNSSASNPTLTPNNITSLHPTNYLTERTTYKRKAGEDNSSASNPTLTPNNITSLHPTNYLTERTTYKRKAGEDNSSASNPTLTPNNITSLHPTNYLTERTTYKRKAGEDNSSASNPTLTPNKNAQKKYKFYKENTSKLQNLNKNKCEIQNNKITETTTNYQRYRQLSPKSKSLFQSKAHSINLQKSKPFAPNSNPLSQSNAQSNNNMQSLPPKPKAFFPSNAPPTDSQKFKPFSSKLISHTQGNVQPTGSQKSKPYSPKSKSLIQSSVQPTDTQKSKPFTPKSESLTQSNAQPTGSQKSKPYSPKSKSLIQSSVQPTDTQKSKPLTPKSKPLIQSSVQPTDTQKSKPFTPKSESLTQSNAQTTDSQKSKPFSPKSKLPVESSSQLTDPEKSEPDLLKSKSLIQSSVLQPTDAQKSEPFTPKSKSLPQSNARPDSQKSKPFSPKSKLPAENSSQLTDPEKSEPYLPKSKSLIQSSVQPTDTKKSEPFTPKSKSLPQSNTRPNDSQKSKPFSPKSKLPAESSSQLTDPEKSEPYLPKSESLIQSSVQPTITQNSKPYTPKSESLTQSNAQTTDSQKSKPFSPKSKSHAHGNALPTDSQKINIFSPKSKSHTQGNAQPSDAQKSKSFTPKSKSFNQSNAQTTDSQKSKPFTPKSKSHAHRNTQPTDAQKSKPFTPKLKSLTQNNAQTTDSQKSKPFTPKSKLHVESNAQPSDPQKSNPLFLKSKTLSQSNAQPTDSQKSKPFIPKSQSFSQSNALLINSQMYKPIYQTEELQSFDTLQSKSFGQIHDSEKTKSPTEINNLESAASQKSEYKSNEPQQSSISLDKFSESMHEENVKETKKETINTANRSINHAAVSPTFSFNTSNYAISNLINPKTYLSNSSLDQFRANGNVEHTDKQKDTSSSKKINGKYEILQTKNLPQKTENNNAKSFNFISTTGHLKKTATPSLNTENEKIQEIKQQSLKMERINQGANISNMNYKINLKKEPTTNSQLIRQIKLEEKKLMLAQRTVSKENQQLEKSKILYSGRKYKPADKTGNTVEINTSKVVKKINKQSNTEQNPKAEKQFSKALNTEKAKFIWDHNMGNKKSEKTQPNQFKNVKRKQKEVKGETIYKQENFQMTEKTHNQVHTRDNQNENLCEHTAGEKWANTEYPQRKKLSIKPILPIKQKFKKKINVAALNPVKITPSQDYDVKIINKPSSAKMNRSKFIFSDSKASLSTITEYNRILSRNIALNKNAPIHPIRYSIKSIIEEDQNNKKMQMGKIANMRPTFRENGINVESEVCNERKVERVNVKNNNADKKYKIWSPTEDSNPNKVDKVGKEKKTSGWGGRLFQLFKNVISRDLDDEHTRTQISNNCLKLKEKLPPVNDLRTEVFIANKIPNNWKANNKRSFHENYDNRMIDNLNINETNRLSSLNKTSKKGLYTAAARNNKSMKATTAHDRQSSSINHQKIGHFNTATDEPFRKRKKEVMAYFGKKVTYHHNMDAGSMDNLSSRIMDCRPYRKPVRLMSRFKPLYNYNNNNDN